jgi:hypothetical protein
MCSENFILRGNTIYIGEKMNVYQLKNGCVEVQVRHYPPKRYKVFRYKLKSRRNSLAIYVHDQKDTECSIAFWVTIIPKLCHDELCGDSRE